MKINQRNQYEHFVHDIFWPGAAKEKMLVIELSSRKTDAMQSAFAISEQPDLQ